MAELVDPIHTHMEPIHQNKKEPSLGGAGKHGVRGMAFAFCKQLWFDGEQTAR